MQFYQQASVVEKEIPLKYYKYSRIDTIVGGIGVKKTRKPVVSVVSRSALLAYSLTNAKQGFTGQATVARCTSCLYELNFQDIENDVAKLGQ